MLGFIKFSGRHFLLYAILAFFVVFGILAGIGAYDIQKDKEVSGESLQMGGALGFEPFPSAKNQPLGLARFPDENSLIFGENATLGLAKKLSNEILAKNPQGPMANGGTPKVNVPETQAVINEFLERGLKEFDYEALKPKISDNNIKIIGNAQETANKSYANSFFAILNKSFGAKENEVRNVNDVEGSATLMVEIYNDYIKSFYELNVPKQLVDIHKKELSLLIAGKKIFEMLRDYESDPLKAAIALSAFQSIKNEMAMVYEELAIQSR